VIGIDLPGHTIYRLSDRLSGTTNVFQVAAPQAGLQLFHGVICRPLAIEPLNQSERRLNRKPTVVWFKSDSRAMRSLGWLSSSMATISKGAANKVAPSLSFLLWPPVRHVVIDRPWHYLEKSAVERGWQTIPVGDAGTGWMEVIHVYACPYDLDKL
jgi:hypothetical protein